MTTIAITIRAINGNHAEDTDRRWLGKHAYWAMRNGYAVNTVPLTAAEYEDRKNDPAYARPPRPTSIDDPRHGQRQQAWRMGEDWRG